MLGAGFLCCLIIFTGFAMIETVSYGKQRKTKGGYAIVTR